MPVSLSPPFSSLKSPWSFSTLGGPPHWHGTLEQPPWPSGGGFRRGFFFPATFFFAAFFSAMAEVLPLFSVVVGIMEYLINEVWPLIQMEISTPYS